MTPFFNPALTGTAARIFLAGVGPAMTEVAGEVADGFMVHPFSSEKFCGRRRGRRCGVALLWGAGTRRGSKWRGR